MIKATSGSIIFRPSYEIQCRIHFRQIFVIFNKDGLRSPFKDIENNSFLSCHYFIPCVLHLLRQLLAHIQGVPKVPERSNIS